MNALFEQCHSMISFFSRHNNDTDLSTNLDNSSIPRIAHDLKTPDFSDLSDAENANCSIDILNDVAKHFTDEQISEGCGSQTNISCLNPNAEPFIYAGRRI